MSRLPLEQMMASFRPDSGSPKEGTMGAESVVVMGSSSDHAGWSDAAARLGQAGDVGELLGGLLREQHEQRLGGDSPHRADPTERRGLALVGEVLPEEPDRLPVLVGTLDN